MNLCGDSAYRNYVRSHSVLQNHAGEVVSILPSEPIELISLGAGQCTKDFLILAGETLPILSDTNIEMSCS